MSRLTPSACALVVVLLAAAGCGDRSSRPVYELPPPAPPGEDKPVDEVSQNLALALGAASGNATNLEERRGKLPKELVGDQQNADYSGERLIGSVATATPSASPAVVPPEPATPPAPAAVKAIPAAPAAAPRVAVESKPAAPPQVPQAPKTAAAPKMAAGAATPPPPAAAPAAPEASVASAATSSGVIAQIAAFRTRVNAEGGWQRLRTAYPDLLGDRTMILQETDLGERGVFYRVRTGPFADAAEAETFCGQLRARDQACVVVNPN